ncbi:hypothetical protein P7C70_g2926, partial [Phenoliferia sp. Uapishka_3]
MFAIIPLFLAFVLGAAAGQQSAVPSVAVCPKKDNCKAPLCTGGASYDGNGDFTCFYSELAGSQSCSYPLTTSSDLYCVYSNVRLTSSFSCPPCATDAKVFFPLQTGALVGDHNDGCCKDKSTSGTRPSALKAREPSLPMAGNTPSDKLRRRVAEWRERDNARRALVDVGLNEAEKRAVKNHVKRSSIH